MIPKMKHYFALIIISFLFQCSADLRQVPPPTKNGNLTRNKVNLPIVIGKFEILSADRGIYTDAWRMAWKGHLQSSGIFSNVYNELDPKEVKDFYTIDVEMKTIFSDRYNWWYTWPAVYPFIAIWPIQYRLGEYSVEFHYKLYLNKDLQKEEIIIKKGNAEEFLYGFFKVRNFHRMIEETNLEAVNVCLKNLESSL
ncbi:lipoprotein [Leptospira ellinghausenii]|uniref:Lipoprotein n=2 Tax=Leptospira ellinghausenii TaxID=1917822 RepID=A0A2P2DEP1_9LEPT|nr:lipoprotein [Leptospira ellinghausenii]